MSDKETSANEPSGKKPDGRKNRTGKKGRVLTFVYSNESDEAKLVRVKTNAFSASRAWEETIEKDSLTNCKLIMTLQGLVHEVENDVLRKPTYDELAQLAGYEKIKSE